MPMSEEHKAALAQGRRESRAVKKYLTALNSRRPGRPVTLDGLKKKIDSIDTRLENEEDPLKVLDLRQERLDAEDSLEELESRGSGRIGEGLRRRCQVVLGAQGDQLYGVAPDRCARCGSEEGRYSAHQARLTPPLSIPIELHEPPIIDSHMVGQLVQKRTADFGL